MNAPASTTDTRIAEFAEQFGFSPAAVRHLLDAVAQGAGDMAIFDHPELAGPGQWMRGGLIMITDTNNHVLKNRIDALCNALSKFLREARANDLSGHHRINPDARAWDTVEFARQRWWPAELGETTASGEQNDLAYAYFDAARRLAIRRAGRVAVFDTGEHRITGTAQSQQGSVSRVVFTSQLGEVPLERLSRVDEIEDQSAAERQATPTADTTRRGSDDIFEAIERLGELHRKGLLTDSEFAAKKQELLDRL